MVALFRPGESDVDLLVDFHPMEPVDKAKAYFALHEELEGLFGAAVDLVSVKAVKNPNLAREMNLTKQLLYAA